MRNYGLVGPWVALAREAMLRGRARLGCAWSQRNVQVEAGVRLASTVRVRGSGEIVIRAGATVEEGVELEVAHGATMELGAGCRVGARSRLRVRQDQRLELGPETEVETDVTIVSVAGAATGRGAVIGAQTAIVCREPNGSGRFWLGAASHLSTGNLVDICADVIIGDDVRTGPACAFYTHKHTPHPDELIWEQPIATQAIQVAEAVWIGHACQIMPGVQIGGAAIIGAGAVVTKDVPLRAVVGGVPARVLRSGVLE